MKKRVRKQNKISKKKSIDNKRKTINSPETLGQYGRWVVGFHAVLEVLRTRPNSVQELWINVDRSASDRSFVEILNIAEAYHRLVNYKYLKEFSCFKSNHQGVACRVVSLPIFSWESLDNKQNSLIIILDELTDPQNLGSILRSAWLMGADAIFVPQHRASPVTQTVAKIASGGAEHVPVETQTSLQRSIVLLKEKGFWIYGLDAQSKKNLWETSFADRVALVVGSESRGIRSSLRQECDDFIKIFQREKTHSYNASVAAALAMNEICRQREVNKKRPKLS